MILQDKKDGEWKELEVNAAVHVYVSPGPVSQVMGYCSM